MKRFLFFIFLSIPVSCFAGIGVSSTTVGEIWDVVGSSNNSGLFDPGVTSPGTDYSQQFFSQYNSSDLATTSALSTPCVVTSAAHSFDSTDVGNYLTISGSTGPRTGGAFIFGKYRIENVDGGGGAILDRACGGAGPLMGGMYRVGGAMMISGVAPWGNPADAVFEFSMAGTTFWIKAGSHTLNGVVTINGLTAVGASSATIKACGYNTARGDNPTGTNRPAIYTGALVFTSAAQWEWRNLFFTGSPLSGFTAAANNRVINCKFLNTRGVQNGVAFTGSTGYFIDNEFISYNSTAVVHVAAGAGYYLNNYIHDSQIGFGLGSAAPIPFYGNLVIDCSSVAVRISGVNNINTSFLNNTIYGAENQRGVGIYLAKGTGYTQIVNNIIYGTTMAIQGPDVTNSGITQNNNFYNNTVTSNNWTGDSSNLALDPQFTSVHQLTGSTATTSGLVLTMAGGSAFSTVTDGTDIVYIKSGTGVILGRYGIVSHTDSALTLDKTPGTDATADKEWEITTGMNFEIGTNLKARGWSGYAGQVTTSYLDIGGAQREESTSGGSGGSFTFVQ